MEEETTVEILQILKALSDKVKDLEKINRFGHSNYEGWICPKSKTECKNPSGCA